MGAKRLGSKLVKVFLLQAAVIAVATVLGVYAASRILEGVLLRAALTDEMEHYLTLLETNVDAPLPDVSNLTAYRRSLDGSDTVPSWLADLEPGFHSAHFEGEQVLVDVADSKQGRLYMVFKAERVRQLAVFLGLVPLAIVLVLIYLGSWVTYRLSHRAMSPIIWLANRVNELDPRTPDADLLDRNLLPADADEEVLTLLDAMHSHAQRIEEFVDRERNFTRDASHELRTPLTVIKVAVDTFLEEGDELSDFGRKRLTKIKSCVVDMEALMEALLLLARDSSEASGLSKENVVMNDLLREQVERSEILVANKSVEVVLEENASFEVEVPSRVLEVMVGNLIRNACLYTDEGRVVIRVGEGEVVIDDTGIGMNEEDITKAFEPHFRGRHSKRGGHGVGLTIVRRLSDRFDWPVTLESELGVGTRATVTFPEYRLVEREISEVG